MNPTISVSVQAKYLQEQSQPQSHKFVFAYTVTIANEGEEQAQLISRRWLITNGNGEQREVSGIGVVGETPVLAPGEVYTYTSGAVIETDTGTMEGAYQMRNTNGDLFEVTIPAFALVSPNQLH